MSYTTLTDPIGMDLIIKALVIEKDREEHISKHGITLVEVKEIVTSDYVFIEGKLGRWQIIGKTSTQRFVTVIIGPRTEPNTYGLVTARDSKKKEIMLYKESKSGSEKIK